MPTTTPSTTALQRPLREGRRRFFAAQGFAPDGGYDDPWAEASFGPVPYAIVNTRARADALRVHDLHHVLTGYDTDWRSESWISAWELGSGGGGRHVYAWFIALFGLWVGLWVSAGTTWRAYLRGRGSRNLYAEVDPSSWLERSIGDVRQALAIRDEPRSARVLDAGLFGLWTLAATAMAAVFVLGSPLLVLLAAMRRVSRRTPGVCPWTCRWSGTAASG